MRVIRGGLGMKRQRMTVVFQIYDAQAALCLKITFMLFFKTFRDRRSGAETRL